MTAGVSIGAAFVGAFAGALVVADVLRLLHGGQSFSVVAVDRDALILLSAFAEHSSDHERIAACRRAFRSAARFIHGVKVRTLMLRDDGGMPVAVIGYLDVPPSETELREAVEGL